MLLLAPFGNVPFVVAAGPQIEAYAVYEGLHLGRYLFDSGLEDLWSRVKAQVCHVDQECELILGQIVIARQDIVPEYQFVFHAGFFQFSSDGTVVLVLDDDDILLFIILLETVDQIVVDHRTDNQAQDSVCHKNCYKLKG